jgi:hypothetical protein
VWVGACCFRDTKLAHIATPVPWLLNWIWIHPFCRRKGLLTKAWPQSVLDAILANTCCPWRRELHIAELQLINFNPGGSESPKKARSLASSNSTCC